MSETLYFRPCRELSGDRAMAYQELEAAAWDLLRRLADATTGAVPEIPLDSDLHRG